MDANADAINALVADIKRDARVGRLKLPTLPDVAYRIREALASEERNAQQVARIVQMDPSLSARLLQVANSARYFGNRPVANVRDAIARLGLTATRNLATALSLQRTLATDDPRLQQYMHSVWEESCRVAAIANVLASITPGLEPDRALLGGLVHNIGVLTLVPYLSRHSDLASDPDLMDLALGRLRARLGTALLKHWRFDPALAVIPEQVDDWLRDSGPDIDYVDVVLVARVHATFGTRKGAAMLQSLRNMPAFRKFPISSYGPDASIQLIEEAQGEIGAMMSLLGGRSSGTGRR